MRESHITKGVMDHWRTLGLPRTLVASIPNMGARGQYGLTKGLPDLMVLGDFMGVGFIELKAEKGRMSPSQVEFQSLCRELGIEHRVTWGRDDPIAVLEEWGIVRRQAG